MDGCLTDAISAAPVEALGAVYIVPNPIENIYPICSSPLSKKRCYQTRRSCRATEASRVHPLGFLVSFPGLTVDRTDRPSYMQLRVMVFTRRRSHQDSTAAANLLKKKNEERPSNKWLVARVLTNSIYLLVSSCGACAIFLVQDFSRGPTYSLLSLSLSLEPVQAWGREAAGPEVSS